MSQLPPSDPDRPRTVVVGDLEATRRGRSPLAAWAGEHRVGVLDDSGAGDREVPARCGCSAS
ncbi:hypothetical protein KMZ32_12505 [Phycicoccus sp. MAQZ13P-2]|uniref:hypothetical protein n=1 Tax=Phycicoccus mangrovi TaxID=2840470 RepID=UPI001BFFEAE1|nr:hypothetical protein [Phycicoccus mangrovi]MBT9256958.1 hypothetical protein [Phycicoccus mangrovi]MBT9274893.1 hypothetical protein [Phycicoccus mangrovi]